MKKTLALAAALTVLWTASSWAAATVGLNNYGTGAGQIFWEQTPGNPIAAPTAGTFVQLVVTATGAPVTDAATGDALIAMSEDGRFYGGTGVVPGAADSATVELTLRAWRDAASWDAATARGSATWSQATGAWNPQAVPPAPATGPDMLNPAVTIVVPEPSTIALGLLGGAALLLFRRK